MILKICPYCQAENPENANFCKKCGALFRGKAEKRDTVAERKKKINKLIIAACAVLIITAIAVIMRDTGDAPEVSTSATSGTTEVATTESTTLPALTIAPSANATTAPVTTTVPSTTVTTTAPAVLTAEEICRQYNDLIGTLKATATDVTIHKTEKINMEITHFSLPVPTDTINSFMTKLIPETDITYNFTNGVAKEDGKVTLSGFIPPAVKAVPDVTKDDLLSAEKDANGAIILKFKADTSTFADGQTVMPQYVDSATDVLDFANFGLGPVKIVKADIQYPGAEIKAETDAEGKLIKLTVYQPVTVMSTGGVGSLTADVGMNLKATTTYEIK